MTNSSDYIKNLLDKNFPDLMYYLVTLNWAKIIIRTY